MQVGRTGRRSSLGIQTTGTMFQRFGDTFARQRGIMRAAADEIGSVGQSVILAVNTFNQASPTVGLYRQRSVAVGQTLNRSA